MSVALQVALFIGAVLAILALGWWTFRDLGQTALRTRICELHDKAHHSTETPRKRFLAQRYAARADELRDKNPPRAAGLVQAGLDELSGEEKPPSDGV